MMKAGDMAIERALGAGIIGTLLVALTACAAAGPSARTTLGSAPAYDGVPGASGFTYTTVDDEVDPSFNEILGIDDGARLVGFYGSGSASDPSVGYIVSPPYQQNDFRKEAYPGGVDTELTGISDKKTIVGFYRDTDNDVNGLIFVGGIWTNVKHPHGMPKGQSVTELLGVNTSNVAVGFYTDSSGVNEAFTLDLATGKYRSIDPPGGNNAVATSIDGRGDVVGYLEKHGHFVGFLVRKGSYTEFSYPGATDTKFLGVTVYDQIVGAYSGSSGTTRGFLLTNPLKRSISWERIEEPSAAGTTVVTGINQGDDIVGYYVDSAGNTNGFFASRK